MAGSAAAMALLMVSIAMAAQDPFQQAEQAAKESPGTRGKVTAKSSGTGADQKAARKPEPEFVRKSFEEWRRILPRGVFEVTRLKATEPAFTGKYATGHFNGTFVCACCDAALFSSRTKFESGTGWPSFWAPIKPRAIDQAIDNSEAEPRMEVMCHRCGAHLGHVFDDGPPPTGLRFCINSLSLELERPAGDAARPAAAKTRAKPRTRTARARSRGTARTTRSAAKARPTDPVSEEPGDRKADEAPSPAKGRTSGA